MADDAIEVAALGFATTSLAELEREVAAMGPPRWLFRGVWASEDYGVVAGSAKAGKSWACLDAAISAASGIPWLGRFEADLTGTVLYFAGEGGKRKILRRSHAICESKGLNLPDLPVEFVFRPPNLSDPAALELFRQTVERVRPVLVVLDPFYLSGGAKADATKLQMMGEVLVGPQLACQDAGAAFMVAAHTNRSKGAKGLDQISGAGLAEWGRTFAILTAGKRHSDLLTGRTTVEIALELIGDEIGGDTLRLKREIWQDDPADLASPMHYLLSSSDGHVPGSGRDVPPNLRHALKVLEDADGWLTRSEVRERLRFEGQAPSATTVRNHLDKLEDLGRIEKRLDNQTNAYRLAPPIDPMAERIEEVELI